MAADRMELAERFDKRLLGLGLYWAWLFVTFYTPVLFPAADAAADLAREAWSWAAWAHALTLLVCAALGHRLSAFADSPRERPASPSANGFPPADLPFPGACP